MYDEQQENQLENSFNENQHLDSAGATNSIASISSENTTKSMPRIILATAKVFHQGYLKFSKTNKK